MIRIRLQCAAILAAIATASGAHAAPRGELAAQTAALAGNDAEAAARAAEALGATATGAAHDALLDALALGLPPAVAIAAIGALAKHPAPSDVAALRRYAGHHTPNVRSAAIAALAMYPDPAARAAVLGALRDPVATVRAAAANAAAAGRIREAVEPLIALLATGDEAASHALAQLADVELARVLGDKIGSVPDPLLAKCLGQILKRPDFGPDPARVQVVRTLAKISDAAATTALGDYIDGTPKTPPRPSRKEAESILEARLGGGGQ